MKVKALRYGYYLPFSLYLKSRGATTGMENADPGRSYWLQPVLVYVMVAIGVILANLAGPKVDVGVANGKVWNTGDIYGASTLVTLFTMVFIALLALMVLYQAPERLEDA